MLDGGGNVLFEGAQGTLLDIDHGTYPFVTSSNPVAGAACTGTGVGPKDIDEIWGIAKAYATRVGAGPFPTELDDELGDHAARGRRRVRHDHRPRRAASAGSTSSALRYAARINSLDHLAITKLDVLTGLGAAQRLHALPRRRGGDASTTIPYHQTVLHQATGEYERAPGLGRGHHRVPRGGRPAADRARLPRFISDFVGVPVALIGVGPGRDQVDLDRGRARDVARRPQRRLIA